MLCELIFVFLFLFFITTENLLNNSLCSFVHPGFLGIIQKYYWFTLLTLDIVILVQFSIYFCVIFPEVFFLSPNWLHVKGKQSVKNQAFIQRLEEIWYTKQNHPRNRIHHIKDHGDRKNISCEKFINIKKSTCWK